MGLSDGDGRPWSFGGNRQDEREGLRRWGNPPLLFLCRLCGRGLPRRAERRADSEGENVNWRLRFHRSGPRYRGKYDWAAFDAMSRGERREMSPRNRRGMRI